MENRSTLQTIPLLDGEQFVYEIRCPEHGKLLAKVMLELKADGVLEYDKLKTMLAARIGGAAKCSWCRNIKEDNIKI